MPYLGNKNIAIVFVIHNLSCEKKKNPILNTQYLLPVSVHGHFSVTEHKIRHDKLVKYLPSSHCQRNNILKYASLQKIYLFKLTIRFCYQYSIYIGEVRHCML